MNRKAIKTCAAGFAVGIGLLGGAVPAMGQTPPGQTPPTTTTVTFPGDWPNLGAYTNRQGRNGNPFAYSSGRTLLRYLTPNTVQDRSPILLDNTDTRANERSRYAGTTAVALGQPPYDNPLNSAFYPDSGGGPSVVQSYATPLPNAAAWPSPDDVGAPLGVTRLASGALVPSARLRDYDTTGTIVFPFDPTVRNSAYNYATSVPTARDQADATIPEAGSTASRKFFQWTFAPTPGVQRTYSVYVHVPLGPTIIPTGNGGVYAGRFAQQYFVYEILWGTDADNDGIPDTVDANGDGVPDNRIVDVRGVSGVDGYVRLGVSGDEESTVFPVNAAANQRIVVRLYNTVPRYAQLPTGASEEKSQRLVLSDATVADTNAPGTERTKAALRLVYADAASLRPETGTFAASPTVATISGNGLQTTPPVGLLQDDPTADFDVTVARNNLVTGFRNGRYFVANQGVVTNYEANPQNTTYPFGANATPFTPFVKWNYRVLDNTSATSTLDNGAATASSSGADSFTPDTVNPNHIGGDYASAPIVTGATGATSNIQYTPNLGEDGDYDVYVYIPGNNGGQTYAANATYVVHEGATATTATLDQTVARGWVRLGTRRFTNVANESAGTGSLSVDVTNYSPGDAAPRRVYADAIRFVGTANGGVTSTPVHATVAIRDEGGATTSTVRKVVVVADEAGKIHCLDEVGRGDGTTTEYWSYPSTSTGVAGYKDPNIWEIVAGTAGPGGAAGTLSGIDGQPNFDPSVASTVAPRNVPTAHQPTGFNLGTAVVAHVGTRDLLTIGATDGRVYCLDMGGRGDYSTANRTVGSTARQWTFPADYDPTDPTAPLPTSGVGAFRGSVVYAEPGGQPTVYVPAGEGRVYALDAAGDATTRSTTTRWSFPTTTHAPVPPIRMTPTYFTSATLTGGRLFFGTGLPNTSATGGQFYCLDATTGNVVWELNGEVPGTAGADAHITATTLRLTDAELGNDVVNPTTGLANPLIAFTTGPVAVAAETLNDVPTVVLTTPTTAPASPDTVYVLNDNGVLYGLRADTGTLVTASVNATARTYRTSDLTALSDANLSYTVKRYFNRDGGLAYFPVVTVPTLNGEVLDEYARVQDYDIDGGYRAGGDTLDSANGGVSEPAAARSVAAADNFRFVTDAGGGFYAFDDLGGFGSTVPGFDTGVTDVKSANDPTARAFRHLRIRLVNADGYKKLTTVLATGTGDMTYADLTGGTYDKPHTTNVSGGDNPYAFEWGEKAYVVVYGFPYATYNAATPPANNRVGPPSITITLSVAGRQARQYPVDSRQFKDPLSADYVKDSAGNDIVDGNGNHVVDPNGTEYRQDGYAVVAIPFSAAGATALPPGSGRITARLSTAALGTNTAAVPVEPDTTDPRYAVDFIMANPLALAVLDGQGLPVYGIGYSPTETSAYTSNEEVLRNGTYNITTNPLLSQLQQYARTVGHGTSTTTQVAVYDRSLMGLLTEDGIGNIRLERSNLTRQGTYRSILNGLDPALYPGFEDEIIGFPNKNADYPDLGREQLRASAKADGSTVNPITTNLHLNLPKVGLTGETLLGPNAPLDAANTRRLTPTVITLTIDVPRYQPPVVLGNEFPNQLGQTSTFPDDANGRGVRHNSVGYALPDQGYFSRMSVFVDSQSDSKRGVNNPAEVFRAFNLSTNVAPQQSILVGSPTLDLGSLASGTGLSPRAPAIDGFGGLFDPWNRNNLPGSWARVYKPISVRNDGNVNLSNLRVAIGTDGATGTQSVTNTVPWALTTADNDPLAYLTAFVSGGTGASRGTYARTSLWSNIDSVFATPNPYANATSAARNRVVLAKPRVTDRVATELVANPVPRANPGIKITRGGSSHQVVDPSTPTSATVGVVDGSQTYRLNGAFPVSQPKVAVSVPLGFPVGNYATPIRVVEDEFPMGGFAFGVNNEVLQYNPSTSIYEAYSDPITLTFKIRETRLTNRTTPDTASMLDDPTGFPAATAGSAAGGDRAVATYRNAEPAAMRTLFGNLVLAWASDRDQGVPVQRSTLGPKTSRIFFGGVRNLAPRTPGGSGATSIDPPLWDLTQFDTGTATNTQWFHKNDSPFPVVADDATLFGGGTLVLNTATYGLPAFPSRGQTDPFTFMAGGTDTPLLMAFVGDAQLTTGTGRVAASKVFVAKVEVTKDGTPGASNIVATASDPATAKGKPAVVGFGAGQGALVFYAETSAGRSGITADRLRPNGTSFATPVPLDFGDGFASVFAPSATARRKYDRNVGPMVVEMSFAGKLRGRPNAEVYQGRLRLNTPATTDANDRAYNASVTDSGALHLVDVSGRTAEYAKAGSPFQTLADQANERLAAEGDGLYRARGVEWDRSRFLRQIQDTANFAISPVVQYLPASATPIAPIELLVRGSAQVDRQSGLIVCDSRLGGKAYIDPELGTVRFTGATPNRNAEIRVTYRPTFLRVTPGGAASYSAVNGLFDDRLVAQYDDIHAPAAPFYWFSSEVVPTNPSPGNAPPPDPNVAATQLHSDRYFYVYGRGAAGGGITARPYTTTMRLGVRLPTRIATDGAGRVIGLKVENNNRPYQADPANGRVYFQAEDEDNGRIRITYTGVNEAKNEPLRNIVVDGVAPSFVLERAEAPIAVDEAANDSAVTAFLDPFTYVREPRPPLVWLFYTSTRAGQPDLYFQTIAPQLLPFAK